MLHVEVEMLHVRKKSVYFNQYPVPVCYKILSSLMSD
jgi:hypothetical protein